MHIFMRYAPGQTQPRRIVAGILLAGVMLALQGFAEDAVAKPPTGIFNTAVDIVQTPLRVKALPQYGQQPLTVEFWTKLPTDKKQRDYVLLSHLPEDTPGSWEVYTTPLDGLLSVRVTGAQVVRLPTYVRVTDNQWHAIAFTWADNQLTAFVDGRSVGTVAVPAVKAATDNEPIVTDGEMFVGGNTEGVANSKVKALVDELRISKSARKITAAPKTAFKADEQTVALWHFDETTGNTHRDESPLGNQLAYSPGIESAWTPRSATRPDAPDWEKETDDNWHDDRFDKMKKGSVLGCSMTVPKMLGNDEVAYATKGLAISLGENGEAGVLFDRANLQLMAGWTGGFVTVPSRRFGLIQHPQPVGDVMFSQPSHPGWHKPGDIDAEKSNRWSPLPRQWGRYLGMHRQGKRVVLSYAIGGTVIYDAPAHESVQGHHVIRRTIEVAPTQQPLTLHVLRGKQASVSGQFGMYIEENDVVTAAHLTTPSPCSLRCSQKDVIVIVPPHDDWLTFTVRYFRVKDNGRFAAFRLRKTLDELNANKPQEKLLPLTRGGAPVWKETVQTAGQLGESAGQPFAIDTLKLPEQNPWGSVFYVTGLAFLPDDRLAICTIYGDVWIASGVTADLKTLTWKRFAAGLYQPMGLLLKDGILHVLERGQVTALRDINNDDEADVYENYYNGWQTAGAGHAYDTGLHPGPDGSLFLFKGQTGGNSCTESGCLLKIAADGRSHEVFATGFRHPIGLGTSPSGMVTGADQQGNWMPATRIDRYRKGGFYGDMRTHHRKTPPKIYDAPVCWLPRDVDNSAGGQVWVPNNTWGPLANQPLHLSWGRCKLYLLMTETVGDTLQGGVVSLTDDVFLSGPLTGKFRPDDGHLYVVGLHGWQTAGVRDGCLQRVRRTSEPLRRPHSLRVLADGVELQFSDPLDRKSATAIENWQVEQWNYRWSAAYGSDHWSVNDPKRQGHDAVKVTTVELSDDGKTVTLRMPQIKPVMQLKIACNVNTADGSKLHCNVHHTINKVPAKP